LMGNERAEKSCARREEGVVAGFGNRRWPWWGRDNTVVGPWRDGKTRWQILPWDEAAKTAKGEFERRDPQVVSRDAWEADWFFFLSAPFAVGFGGARTAETRDAAEPRARRREKWEADTEVPFHGACQRWEPMNCTPGADVGGQGRTGCDI